MHRQIAGALTGRVTKWFVLVFWLIVFAGGGMAFGQLQSVQNNQAQSWLPGSAESTLALKKLEAFQNDTDIPTSVVYVKKSGITDADFQTIAGQITQFEKLKGAIGAKTPTGEPLPPQALITLSPDKQVAVAKVTFNLGKNGWNDLPPIVKDIRAIAHIDGATVHIAGPGGQAADSAAAFKGLDGSLLLLTLIAVVVILLVAYRSPVLWILPIFSAVSALMGAGGLIYLLAKYAGLTVNGQSQAILTILVVGAGTDYALLLVARYREELHNFEDRHEAMAHALHRAAPAVIASAATVALGMLCLMFAEMNSTAGLGPVTAIGVGVALLAMITLLPALLVICGRWIFWPVRPKFDHADVLAKGVWYRVGGWIKPRPRVVWVITALILAGAAAGVSQLNAHGLNTADSYTKKFDSVVGQEVLAAHGMGDTSAPVMVVANAPQAQAVREAMMNIPNLAPPGPAFVKDGVALIQAPLQSDATGQKAFDTVDKVRTAVHAVPGANALVGGQSAFMDDTEVASNHDSRTIIPIVLALVMLILMLLLRAIVAPIILIATVILSFGAALGIGALVFKYAFGFAGQDASFPLFVFVFLVALGIDYNIFLMTRVREETQVRGTREGSLVALSATGGVITSAGLVLAATFTVLATLPLVFLVELGFTIALGVLLDTLIVRSVLVTAINLDLGGKIWWPSRLDRGDDTTPPAARQPAEVNA